MQRGMAPPQGFALSIFLSKSTVSIPFSWAKISAAHAPDGPPPTTATLYFMERAEEDTGLWATGDEVKEKAVAVDAMREIAAANFMVDVYYWIQERDGEKSFKEKLWWMEV